MDSTTVEVYTNLIEPEDGPSAGDRQLFKELYGHEPDADHGAIASWVDDQWHEQDAAAWSRFHRWSYNIRFAAGDQWLITLDRRSYFEPPAPSGTVRVTNNLTWKALQYRISKLTENRQVGKVLPHSNEVDDADKAEASQQFLLHQNNQLDLGARYDEALWYDGTCGCAFLYIGFDAETGQFISAKKARLAVDEETGEPKVEEYFIDASGDEVAEDVAFRYRTGDVSAIVIPPWQIRVGDPTQTDPARQRIWMWGTAETVQEIKRRFGEAAKDISGGAEWDQFVFYQDLISGWSVDGQKKQPKDRPFEPRSLIIQLFERPSEAYPMGRHIVVCERKLLHYGPLPFVDEDIEPEVPIVQLRTEHKPMDFYGKSSIEDLIPVQKRINQLESHCMEYIRLFTRGGIAAEYGTVIEESWTDAYGSIMYYSGNRPDPLQWPSLPNDVLQALQRAYENFDRIAGWADVARGDVPPGVKAAKAILELKRANDTPLGKALQRFDRVVEQVSFHLIQRARWGYDEPHWVQIMGRDVPHMVRAITAKDFPTRFSVKIESDSLLRLSYPAKLELLFELADRQWIDRDSAMRLLNFADWEHRSGQWNRDYSMTRLKLEDLEQGRPVGVEWYENDAVCMLAIEEKLKDPRFVQKPTWYRQAVVQLWLEHYKNYAMKQSGQLPPQLQAMMGQPMAPSPETATMQASAQRAQGSQQLMAQLQAQAAEQHMGAQPGQLQRETQAAAPQQPQAAGAAA